MGEDNSTAATELNHQGKMEEDSTTNGTVKSSDSKAPVKLSFAVSKQASARPPPVFAQSNKNTDQQQDVEYVKEFDGKCRMQKEAPAKVIPMMENSWRPEKRMKNIMMETDPLSSTDDRFESETLASGPQSTVQYGLVKRKPNNPSKETPAADSDDDNNGEFTDEKPQLQISVQERDLQRLRDDVDALPDETPMEAYENVSIEEFGEALLRGMGWEKGKPIGRNCTVVVDPIERVRRVGREGLGAVPAPKPDKIKKYIKPGESRQIKSTVGRLMCVISGKHSGLRGQIAEINGNSFTVALLDIGERVVFRRDQLAEIDSVEAEKAISKLKALQVRGTQNGNGRHNGGIVSMDVDESDMNRSTRERGDDKSKTRHRERDDDAKKQEQRSRRDDDHHHKHRSTREGRDHADETRSDKHKMKDMNRKEYDNKKKDKDYEDRKDKSSVSKSKETVSPKFGNSWLARDIRVRIVHKDAYGRKWYLQKGCIVDVISPFLCDIQMDEGRKIIQEVRQEHLETALPKRGGRVMVVTGKYRGEVGRLQERLLDEGIGHVQMEDNYEVRKFNLDDLAEFVGTSIDMED